MSSKTIQLEIEINKIAEQVINRVTKNSTLTCKPLLCLVSFINWIALLLISITYVFLTLWITIKKAISFFIVVYYTKSTESCNKISNILGILTFSASCTYIFLYGIRQKMFGVEQINVWVMLTIFLTISYILYC